MIADEFITHGVISWLEYHYFEMQKDIKLYPADLKWRYVVHEVQLIACLLTISLFALMEFLTKNYKSALTEECITIFASVFLTSGKLII